MTDEPTTTRDADGKLVWVDNRFPDRHEPFQESNVVSLRHGMYSPRVIAAVAEDLRAEVLAELPWCSEPRYALALDLFLQQYAAAKLGFDAYFDDPKRPPRKLESATAAAGRAWNMLEKIGGTPSGFAALKIITAGATSAEAGLKDLLAAGSKTVAGRRHLSEIEEGTPS